MLGLIVLLALLVRHHSVGRSTFGGTTSEGGGYEEAVELFCFRARSSPSEPCGGSGFICVTVLLGGLVGRSTFGGTTSVRCEYGETDARSSPSEPCGGSGSIIGMFLTSQPTFSTLSTPNGSRIYIATVTDDQIRYDD